MNTGIVSRAMAALAFAILPWAACAAMNDEVRAVQGAWERIKYERPAAEQEKAFAALAREAAAMRARNGGSAEAQVWYAIVIASHAGAKGGLGALALAREAKLALERALEIDPRALDGSAYTTLGSLYYQVPGWPIGFGDDAKAREMLEKALAIDPEGIDANFFLGDFLSRQGDKAAARRALEKALAAPPRPDRPLADAGRRQEIRALLDGMR